MRIILFRLAFFLVLNTVLLSASLFAQKLHDFNIYFKNDISEISWNGQHSLDSVVKTLPGKFKFYSVEIIGYSDGKGSKRYNQKLSKNRSKEVADYFLSKGFLENKVKYKGAGVSQILLEEENPKNRKVNIRILLDLPQFKQLGKSSALVESFTVDNAFGGNLKTKSGTILFIPSEIFMDKDSNTILGNVRIEYTEYRMPKDFIVRGLHFNDQKLLRLFHSTGMFEINAFYEDREVYINPERAISVFFGLNQRESLLDLYYKSDTITDWQFVKHLTNKDGKVSDFRPLVPSCGGSFNNNFCSIMGSCERLQYLVNTGIEYSESEISIVKKFKILDSIHVLQMIPLTVKKDSVVRELNKVKKRYYIARESLLNIDSVGYKIERIKRTRNKLVFQLESDLEEFNEMEPLENIEIVYKGKVPDSIFQVVWDNCKISLNKRKTGSLTLKIKGEKYRMKRIKFKRFKQSNEKEDPYESYKKYRSIQRNRLREVEKRQIVLDSLSEELELIKIQLNGINEEIGKLQLLFYNLNVMEFQCLWKLSKPYMDEEESNLVYEGWLEYFEKNRLKMFLRYTTIKKNEHDKFVRCDEIAKQRVEIYQQITLANQIVHLEPEERDTVIIPILINKLGVYNTARSYSPQANQSSNSINKNKTNVRRFQLDSVEVEISCVFLIPDHLNGYYRYDGSYHYDPYSFPRIWHARQSCLLIAYDLNGMPYYSVISNEDVRGNAIIDLKDFKNVDELELLIDSFPE